jgi:diguanylate cyclase (GGDEF)-like protein
VVLRAAAHAEREARALAQACGISHVVPELAEPKVLLAAITAALSEPATPPEEPPTVDLDAIGSHLWPMVNSLYRRVAELEMLNVRTDQSASEYAARLEVARSALAQEVAKRIWAERELTEANLGLRLQAVRDPLTGLYNRRYLEESLDREESRAKRSGRPVGVMMIDIDNFKRCNDTFGHAAGDEVLRSVSRYIQSLARAEDIFCRYGGEEFLLLMTNTSPEAMWERAEGLRQGVQKLRIQHDGRRIGPITLSAGVALFPHHGAHGGEVLEVADAALYRAKESGRNRVVVGDRV